MQFVGLNLVKPLPPNLHVRSDFLNQIFLPKFTIAVFVPEFELSWFITGLCKNLQKHTHCNVGSFLCHLLPILKWLPMYNWKGDILSDIVSGFTVAIMHIPQGEKISLIYSSNQFIKNFLAAKMKFKNIYYLTFKKNIFLPFLKPPTYITVISKQESNDLVHRSWTVNILKLHIYCPIVIIIIIFILT